MSKARKVLTLRLEPEVHKRLKMVAAASEKTMHQIIVDCIERRYQELGQPAGAASRQDEVHGEGK